MHRFSLKHLHSKVFEVQTSGIKHGEFFKKDEKKKIRRRKEKKKWREFNLADAKFR